MEVATVKLQKAKVSRTLKRIGMNEENKNTEYSEFMHFDSSNAIGVKLKSYYGNTPIFNGVLAWNLCCHFQFLRGCYSAYAHIGTFIVVSP